MLRFGIALFVAALTGLIIPSVSRAQTPANISVVQGNGQMICDGCPATEPQLTTFDDLIVLVTDANGNPVPNAVVNWSVTSSTGAGTIAPQTQTGTATGSSATLCTSIGHSCNSFNEITAATQLLIQSTVVASIPNGQSVSFFLTQIPPRIGNAATLYPVMTLVSPQPGSNTLTGPAGSTSATPIQVSIITGSGMPLPDVNVRLIPASGSSSGGPSVSCATAPGADPGSVLSIASGSASPAIATCSPVFGSVVTPGGANGAPTPFKVQVGGVAALQNAIENGAQPGAPLGFTTFELPINILVTAATPAKVTLSAPNGQTAQGGSQLPLVATVTDSSGNPLSGIAVSWTATPTALVSAIQASTTTNGQGQASNAVTLAQTANGQITVTAAVGNLSANLAITATQPGPSISSLTITGPQAAQTNSQVTLTVQGTLTNGTAAAGVTVQLNISGGSGPQSVVTDNTGKASFQVTTGGAAGTLTVTASAGGVSSQQFSIAVSAPPPVSSGSFLNGAGFYATTGGTQWALSPCGIATLVVGSPLSAGAVPATPNMFAAPLQQTQGVSIVFPSAASTGMSTAPLLNISTAITNQQLITFQVPCDATPSSATVGVTINGTSINVPNVSVRPNSPGIFEMVGSDGVRRAIAVRPDGSIVSTSNPARRSETIRIYLTGPGAAGVVPPLATGAVPIPGVISSPSDPNQVVVGLNGNGEGGVTVQASAELIGVYEVTFNVPNDSTVQSGDNVLVVGVTFQGPEQFSQASKLPIQ